MEKEVTVQVEKMKAFYNNETGKYGYMRWRSSNQAYSSCFVSTETYTYDDERCIFDMAYDFNDGKAVVILQGKAYYIDCNERILGGFDTYEAYKDGLCITLDENGNTIIEYEYNGKAKLKNKQ